MFGPISPRLKGGLNRINQALSVGYLWLKGPSDADLLISAGDRLPVNSGTYAGRTLLLQGGIAPDAGKNNGGSGDQISNGGTVTVKGGNSGSAYGIGGSVVVQGGDNVSGNGYPAGATVTIQGGSNLTGGNLTGGIATLIGGTSIGGTGGAANVTGGISASGRAASSVNITGGAGVTIQGGSVNIGGGLGSGGAATGHVYLDGARGALLTTAIGGHVFLPTCAGTPTGAPQNIASGAAVVFDTTNLRLYIYSGGAWHADNYSGVVNSQSANYTTTIADGGSGRFILHPSSDANARTFTIAANSSVAYEVATVIEFVNDSASAVTIAINTDTLVWVSATGLTGSRTLGQYGTARAKKISATRWYIEGTNLT